jgi:hypothetical protein
MRQIRGTIADTRPDCANGPVELHSPNVLQHPENILRAPDEVCETYYFARGPASLDFAINQPGQKEKEARQHARNERKCGKGFD